MLPVRADLCLIHLGASLTALSIGGAQNIWMAERSSHKEASARIVYFSQIIKDLAKHNIKARDVEAACSFVLRWFCAFLQIVSSPSPMGCSPSHPTCFCESIAGTFFKIGSKPRSPYRTLLYPVVTMHPHRLTIAKQSSHHRWSLSTIKLLSRTWYMKGLRCVLWGPPGGACQGRRDSKQGPEGCV